MYGIPPLSSANDIARVSIVTLNYSELSYCQALAGAVMSHEDCDSVGRTCCIGQGICTPITNFRAKFGQAIDRLKMGT